jgi:two-component system, chemotaxis family, protein-glutamate methylesterase/glutaminase
MSAYLAEAPHRSQSVSVSTRLAPSVLPNILARAGKLPARHPHDGEAMTEGVILVAPPDRHMMVDDGVVGVRTGPRQNGHRPAADVLMRSVAEAFGEASAGVVLSGTMDDGAAGLRAIRTVGGLAVVQDPERAAFPGMPLAAIHEGQPHFVGPANALAERVLEWLDELLVTRAAPSLAPVEDPYGEPGGEEMAELTPLTCPECGGTLWHRDDYGAERYRCRVGHAFSADGLMLGKQTALESALWAAIVALEERAEVSRRIARRLELAGRSARLARYRADSAAAEQRAGVLRDLIRELIQGVDVSYAGDEIGDTAN